MEHVHDKKETKFIVGTIKTRNHAVRSTSAKDNGSFLFKVLDHFAGSIKTKFSSKNHDQMRTSTKTRPLEGIDNIGYCLRRKQHLDLRYLRKGTNTIRTLI
ncbi:5104_t:CDS:1 [Funneliformis mosseae]|uniref:5104_t:CDS:1 n=1 Tax=Funneliformis mosseae TaxID=27381 RepID=A0A9N9DYZ4_FUNMO|nr:5104_t:CDS:1 [Funneliformis mosseae]